MTRVPLLTPGGGDGRRLHPQSVWVIENLILYDCYLVTDGLGLVGAVVRKLVKPWNLLTKTVL